MLRLLRLLLLRLLRLLHLCGLRVLHQGRRRLLDGAAIRAADRAEPVLGLNKIMMMGAWSLALVQLPFVINFFWSIRKGEKVSSNCWDATTVEWTACDSPPMGHGNFEKLPCVYRGPYEYSVPGCSKDFLPQTEPEVS